MPVSRERFAQGITPEEFINGMTRNRERFEAQLKEAEQYITDDDRRFFAEHPVSVAALAEDWCPDVIQFLPVVVKLAKQVPQIRLRIFLRDQNLDLADQYLKEGEFRSIPTFIFYDDDWNELGHYIERPEKATQAMARETRRFAQENAHLEGINRAYQNMPEATRRLVHEHSNEFRWSQTADWYRYFLDDLKQLLAANWVAERSSQIAS